MTYRSPSTGLGVRAVLFDVFGTVVDWRSGIAAAVGSFADGHDLQLDPHAGCRHLARPVPAGHGRRVRSGARPFVSLGRTAPGEPREALREHGVDPGQLRGRGTGRAVAGLALPAAVAGQRGRDRGDQAGLHRRAAVERGTPSLLLDMAKYGRAGLGPDPRLRPVTRVQAGPGGVPVGRPRCSGSSRAR